MDLVTRSTGMYIYSSIVISFSGLFSRVLRDFGLAWQALKPHMPGSWWHTPFLKLPLCLLQASWQTKFPTQSPFYFCVQSTQLVEYSTGRLKLCGWWLSVGRWWVVVLHLRMSLLAVISERWELVWTKYERDKENGHWNMLSMLRTHSPWMALSYWHLVCIVVTCIVYIFSSCSVVSYCRDYFSYGTVQEYRAIPLARLVYNRSCSGVCYYSAANLLRAATIPKTQRFSHL